MQLLSDYLGSSVIKCTDIMTRQRGTHHISDVINYSEVWSVVVSQIIVSKICFRWDAILAQSGSRLQMQILAVQFVIWRILSESI